MADRNGRKSDPGRGKLPRDVRGEANGLSAVLPPLWINIFLTLGIGLLSSGHALAQIEGARVYFPAPQGTNVFSFGYGKVNQCSQTKDASSSPWNGGLAYRGYFLPSERLDAFPVSPTAGCSAGSVIADPKSTSLNPVINASSGSHFSDSCLGFRGGFIESVLNPDEMVKYRRGFQPFNVRGFNPGGNHGSFFRLSTRATLMFSGGNETGIPRGLLIERPYDTLSFVPTLLGPHGTVERSRLAAIPFREPLSSFSRCCH